MNGHTVSKRPETRRLRGRLQGHLRRTIASYAVLAGMLLLTGIAYVYVSRNVAEQERVRFEEAVGTTQRAVDRRMDTYIDAMLDGRGLFAASEEVTRDEWADYVAGSELERRYPGIRAIAFAERVSPEGLEAHERRVREDGFPSYEVLPSGERFEYFPIVYVEPFEDDRRELLGHDLYSDPASRAAMEQARDSGEPRASGTVELPIEERDSVFLVTTPLYEEGAPRADAVDRRVALRGYIVSVFDADELLGEIFGRRAHPDVDFEVFDGAVFGGENLLHDEDDVLRGDTASVGGSLRTTATLDVAGRVWGLNFVALEGFETETRRALPLFVLMFGLTVSLLLFLFVRALSRSRAGAEQVGRELAATNKELAATNRELEAFSYSVSHDLRAPLRSINGFSQILLEDYEDVLDPEARDYLRRVGAASDHMGNLIDDLLALSRVTRTPLRRETVDLGAMAEDIFAELRKQDPDRDLRTKVEGDLRTTGDPRLLRVALENLLGNAWKFTAREQEAHIRFGVNRSGAHPVYFVEDDGAGFEMAYADKLFGAFQRLHASEEFEGTGIGLATVARVVRRHGGEAWAEGEPGRGATFFFTLGHDGGR